MHRPEVTPRKSFLSDDSVDSVPEALSSTRWSEHPLQKLAVSVSPSPEVTPAITPAASPAHSTNHTAAGSLPHSSRAASRENSARKLGPPLPPASGADSSHGNRVFQSLQLSPIITKRVARGVANSGSYAGQKVRCLESAGVVSRTSSRIPASRSPTTKGMMQRSPMHG